MICKGLNSGVSIIGIMFNSRFDLALLMSPKFLKGGLGYNCRLLPPCNETPHKNSVYPKEKCGVTHFCSNFYDKMMRYNPNQEIFDTTNPSSPFFDSISIVLWLFLLT